MKQSHTNLNIPSFHFLPNTGEMANLINNFDWNSTSIGTIQNWPQSLKITLSIMLNSKFPMFLFWGGDLICFYNDGYRPSLGTNGKHPSILGMKGKQAWPEVWQVIEPLIQQVLSGGEAIWSEDQLIPIYRNGKIEDVYWTFSYSAVIGESGTPEGVFVTCNETTEKVLLAENLRQNKNQLQIATDSANVGTWSLHVQSQKLDWSAVHKKMWGYSETDDNLNYESWHKLIVETDKQLAFERVEQAKIDHSFYDVEYRIKKADDQSIRWIRSLGKYHYNIEGIAETLTGISIDITDAKEQEQISNYRKALLEAQNEAVQDGILIVDTKGTMLSFNNNFIKIWKIPESIINTKDDAAALAYAMTQVKDPKSFIERVEYCYANPTTKAHDELLLKDGRTLERYGNAVTGADGVSYGWAWYFRDITEERNIQNNLKESEERFRNLADQTPLWVWIAGENVYVEYANQAILDFVGLNNYKDLTAHAWEKFVHPDDIQMVYEAIGKAQKESVSFEFRVKNAATQAYEWVLIMAVPRIIKNEFSGFIGTGININKQKLAMQQLEESEIRFRLLADSMPQFVWAGDAEGNLNYFNKSVYNYSGLTIEEIKVGGWLQIVHPDEREENVKQWLHSIKTGEDFNFEHRFKRHDGIYRWQLSRARPQKDMHGNIQMWVGTSTDIHEIKEHVQQKDEFISIASHEMKTPLTTAKGYLELLLATLQNEDDTLYLYANKASQSLQRLHNLVSELLDASKIQNGKLNYTITTFDINSLIDETILDIQHSSRNHVIKKTGMLSKEITADRDRIQQVIINLLTNAVKYSPKANEIIVNVEEHVNKVKISVQDFGVGIAKHHLDKIFDRYYRVQEHAIHFQGLGIGLYISSDIIKRHNGNMWAESEHGKGSTFYFELPI
jgi:PAS domain S-box-containing protein